MDYYLIVKKIHMFAAAASFCGFLLRGYWMMMGSSLLKAKLTRVLPHIVDTALLASAIFLAIVTHQYPGVVNWVSAKVVLLVVYIISGTIALKRGKTRNVRIVAFVFSVFVISAIFGLASAKPALNFF